MTSVFRSLMNRTVKVYDCTADGWPELSWSPMPAAIQPALSATNGDAFYERWPDATWAVWCATDCALAEGYVLMWRAPDNSQVHAVVIGQPEKANGRGWRVPVREVLA